MLTMLVTDARKTNGVAAAASVVKAYARMSQAIARVLQPADQIGEPLPPVRTKGSRVRPRQMP